MILEIAQIEIKPGMEAEFEAGVKKAVPAFQSGKGCRGLTLQRSIEKPQRYRLFVHWDTVENHTVDFRNSPNWQEWRLRRALLRGAARGRACTRGPERLLSSDAKPPARILAA
jgi:heme-degrading monooxygenase HmoA